MPTLAIVSPAPADQPVFEATFPQALSGKHNIVEQLVLNSSLDVLDETVRRVGIRRIGSPIEGGLGWAVLTFAVCGQFDLRAMCSQLI
jgi:hypothetical protein